jgi:hypothetical protein
MVRINLLRNSSHRPAGTAHFTIPRPIIYGVIALVAAVGIGFIGMQIVKRIVASKPQPVVEKKPSGFTPSTYKKTDIVEDVVREISQERKSGRKPQMLDMPYIDLSFLEKVNYEVLYAKNVFSLLSRVVPVGIGLRTLEVSNFETVYAVGLGTSKELVSATFIDLKKEKLELLPQPYSYITSNNGDGYRFVVTCKTHFGLDLTDPFQASDYLPTRDDLPVLTKKLIRIGDENGVDFKGTPKQIDAEKVGAYRRFHYRYRGTTTYNDFVKYLLALHVGKVPCAFKKVDIKAQTGTAVSLETQVVFTVRE